MGLAAFNGGSLLFAGLACVLGAALGFGGLWIGLLLLAFGGVELYGRGRLRAYDPVAARVLVGNQLVLLAAIWLYCGVGAYHGLTTEIPIEDMLGEYRGILQVMGAGAGTDVDSALGSVTDIYRRVIVIFYAGLALMVGLFQGGCALYYHGRVASLRALRGAPTWVHDLIGPA